MAIRAENDPRYSRRFLIMGIVAIGFAFWCLKDAIISYPDIRQRGFEDFKAENPKITATDAAEFEATAGREERVAWGQYAHEYNVKTGPDIVTQYIMAAITGLAGLFLLSIPLRSRGRWIELDKSGLRSSWGQALNLDQIELINKRKWREKGIAKITYRDGARKRRFVIDDFKFMRSPTDDILFEIEQRVGTEKITGGPPEALADEPAEEPTDATPIEEGDASAAP